MAPPGRSIAERLLLTHGGRVAIGVAYAIAALVSVVVYAVVRDPVYAAGQAIMLSIGLLWANWALRRAR